MDNSLRKFLLNKAIKRGEQYGAIAEANKQDELFKRGVDESLRKEKLKQEVVLDKFENEEYQPLDMVLRQSKRGQEVRGLLYSVFEELKKPNPFVRSIETKINRLYSLVISEDLTAETEQAIFNFTDSLNKAVLISTIGDKDKKKINNATLDLLNILQNKDVSLETLKEQRTTSDPAIKARYIEIFTNNGKGVRGVKKEDKIKLLKSLNINPGTLTKASSEDEINKFALANIPGLTTPAAPVPIPAPSAPAAAAAAAAPAPAPAQVSIFDKYRKGTTTLSPRKPTSPPRVVDKLDDVPAGPPTERKITFKKEQKGDDEEDEPAGDDESETLDLMEQSEKDRKQLEDEERREAEKEAIEKAKSQSKGVKRTPQKPPTRAQTRTRGRPEPAKPSLTDEGVAKYDDIFVEPESVMERRKDRQDALTELGVKWVASDTNHKLNNKYRTWKKLQLKGKGKKAGFIKPLWNLIKDIPEGFRRISKPTKTISEVSPFVKELIKLNQSTYRSPVSSSNGWKNIYSNERVRVYKKSDVIIIAVRGTDKTNKEDLSDDMAIVKGTLDKSPRFLELKKIYEAALEQFPNTNIILTGHSLGGGMIIELSKYYPVQGVLFNPAVNFNNLRSNSYNLKNIHTHIIEHDPLALTSSFLPNVSKYKFPFKLTGTPSDHIKAHELTTFLGGRLRRKTKK